jgi:NitT/TauT family transport system ATP-binding protein
LILLVTHNIEEAVLMCDRALVLSSNPGMISAEVAIPLNHPRDRQDPRFRELVDEIYSVFTEHKVEPSAAAGGSLSQILPNATVGAMAGLM